MALCGAFHHGNSFSSTLLSPFLCQTPLKSCHDSPVATQRAAVALGMNVVSAPLQLNGLSRGKQQKQCLLPSAKF